MLALILLGNGRSQFPMQCVLAGGLVEQATFCPSAFASESVIGIHQFSSLASIYYLLFMASFSANLGFYLVGNIGISHRLI